MNNRTTAAKKISAAILAFLRVTTEVEISSSGASISVTYRQINPTVGGFFGTVLGGILPPVWSDAFIAVLCLSIIWLAYRSWQSRGALRYGFSCAVVASILASFHLYDYDLILLLLPILLMAGEIRHRIAKAAVAILYLPVYPALVEFASIYWLFWPIAVFAASLFGLRKPEEA